MSHATKAEVLEEITEGWVAIHDSGAVDRAGWNTVSASYALRVQQILAKGDAHISDRRLDNGARIITAVIR